MLDRILVLTCNRTDRTVKCDAVATYLYFNGVLHPTKDCDLFAQIDGASIYEVIKLIDGTPLFFEDHMQRMYRSAGLIGKRISKPAEEVRREIAQLVEKNRLRDINVKLVWFQTAEQNTGFITYFVPQNVPARASYQSGVHTTLYSGERQNPQVKAIKTSFRERARHAREAAGAFEALMVDENGYISEGTRSNIFFIKNERICTPPSNAVLLGVTRHHVLHQCREVGIIVEEAMLHRNDLSRLEGAFITGTSIDVLPIRSIDDLQLSSASHPLIQKISSAFDERVRDYLKQASYQI